MPLLISILLLSAAALGYEILLMRLFSITQWHHFAYMVISLALLGYGASGTFLTFVRAPAMRRFGLYFGSNAGLFGIWILGSFALAQRVRYNPLEVIWNPGQLPRLFVIYLLLAFPFFCVANCIGLSFSRFPERISRLYRADLVGAGVGALAIIASLFFLHPSTALKCLAGLALLATGVACLDRELGRSFGRAALLALFAVLLPLLWPQSWILPRLSEFKQQSRILLTPGAAVVAERSSPLGLITVIDSPQIPLRHAPGLSLNCVQEPPQQLAVLSDGDSLSVITRYQGDSNSVAYLDYLSSALPYHLLRRPRVLVLGAGCGSEVLLALRHRAARIDAVELNPQIVDLLKRDFADFAGGIYSRPEVRVHKAEARGFVARAAASWDLIQVSLVDSYAASAAGVHTLNESYLYSVEALQEYLSHLEPDGLLAITRWLKVPPRDTLKLFATAVTALRRAGMSNPEDSLVLIRSWKTATLLVKNGRIGTEEISAIRSFCERRWFDVGYYPGMVGREANVYNILEEPYLFSGAQALLSPQWERYIQGYKFDLRPATDNRPYFFHFFKWRSLPELLDLRGRGGVALVDWSYLILLATLFQAALAGYVLILLPLSALRRKMPAGGRLRSIATYFLALGLAFLFVEIAFIQRFTLFLSHPLYAVAVVLAAFLIFAGMGSGASSALARRWRATAQVPARAFWSPIRVAATITALMVLAYIAFLPPLFQHLMGLPDPAKLLISLGLLAPVAFVMGVPFPLGLMAVARRSPDWLPWAWGINGCASVVSAVLATVVAIHFGFALVLVTAAALYGLAAWEAPDMESTSP